MEGAFVMNSGDSVSAWNRWRFGFSTFRVPVEVGTLRLRLPTELPFIFHGDICRINTHLIAAIP